MDDRPDAELTAAVRAGDRAAGDALILRHEGIVRAVIGKVRFPAHVEPDDLMQAGRLAILAAAKAPAFDHARTRWTTYCMTCVRRAVWKEVARLSIQAAGFGKSEDRSFLDSVPALQRARQWFAEGIDALTPTTRLLVRDADTGLHRNQLAAKYGMTTARVRNYLSLGYRFLTGENADDAATGPDSDEADGGGEPGDVPRVLIDRPAA